MADVVRILGLDDDNHAPMFITEDGDVFSTPRELVKWLSHAHDVDYDVRMFSIVGEYTGRLAEYEFGEVDEMFCFLEGLNKTMENEFDLVFDLFWESNNKEWW